MSDDKNAAVAGVDPTPVVAEQQQGSEWPRPGDEGYVHPDGTPQAARQLEDNRRAAADRAAHGSYVHGAPMATPGPQVQEQYAAAVERADEYSGPTTADRNKAVTEYIVDTSQAVADEAADRQHELGEQASAAQAARQSATTSSTAPATAKAKADARTADDADTSKTKR